MVRTLIAVCILGLSAGCTSSSEDRGKAQPSGSSARGGGSSTAGKAAGWHRDERAALAAAKGTGKGVMLDFSATWCAPCEDLDRTFATPAVRKALLAKFVPAKLDMSQQTDADTAIMQRYGVKQLPTVIFLDAAGKERHRITEAVEPPAMLAVLEKL